ncbi:MAG: hypothetical protein H0T76_09830 [Nannocystis sp.]|nr:multiheme c-type cytochrome [Nannocystis sp.]MBA3546769.1 hypothetical protein [Nannocystis sp.]
MPVPEARSARRCGECHESYLTEWSGSAHAEADRSPVYRAMRAQAPDAAACDRCHAPLAAVIGRADPVTAEGVTCEVCHAIAEVTLGPHAASWTLQLAENRKYGPICDAVEPYFHRTGCSPLHAESPLCAACHHLEHVPAEGPAVPVFSEFAEWQHGETMPAGLHCQGCHMPQRRLAVASGGPIRDAVSEHGDGAATGDALRLTARALLGPEGLQISGHIEVSGAPHAVPVGLPGREILLGANLVSGTGEILSSAADIVYSRMLVDAHGEETPFFRALRVGSDTRLRPDEKRSFELWLPAAPPDAHVELRLLERALSPELALALAIELPAPRVLQVQRLTAPWGRAP